MRFRPRSQRRDDVRAITGAPENQAFDALWERHADDLQRTAMAIVQDAEHAREALDQARADALRERMAKPQSLTRARLHRLVRDAAGDRIELFATTQSPAEVDVRTALVLHELGLRVEEIAEALALTQAATHELLPDRAPEPVTAYHTREVPEPEPVLERPPHGEREPLTVAFEPEAEPVATPPGRERRRRPVWQPLAGGGVALAALAGALILLVPGGEQAPVTNGATGLGIGPALPPPAADGSGRPDTRSFGLLASSPESRPPPDPRAGLRGALVADVSQAPFSSERGSPGGGGGERSVTKIAQGGGGPSGGGDRPSGAGRSGGGERPSGDRPSGGGGSSGGGSSGGGGPSDRGPSGGGSTGGGGAPSGGGPVGGGGGPSAAGGGAAGGPTPSPPPAPASSPSPASSPPSGPVQQLVNETVTTVERVAGSLLGGG